MFSYQGVARDASGPLKERTLDIRLSVMCGEARDSLVWQETQTVTTNSFGLFTVEAGTIRPLEIDWSDGPYYLKSELDMKDGAGFRDLGLSRILAVPYALQALTVDTLQQLQVRGRNVASDTALFAVRRDDGKIVFAVYNDGVRVNIDDSLAGRTGRGFVIGSTDMPAEDGAGFFRVSEQTSPSTVSFSMGPYTSADGRCSVAMGYGSTAGNDYAIALGKEATAEGFSSVAIGSAATAGGGFAVALGEGETLGNHSFAAGQGRALGESSAALVLGIAEGYGALAAGSGAVARGNWSTALGVNTMASAYASLVVGYSNRKYVGDTDNWIPSDPLFVVGNGGPDGQNDAFVVKKNGSTVVDAAETKYGLEVTNTSGTDAYNAFGIYAKVVRNGTGNYYSGYFVDEGSGGTYLGLYADTRSGAAADIAEYVYDPAGNAGAGDVVVADTAGEKSVILSSHPYQTSCVGVISTEPHLTMGLELVTDRETGGKIPGVQAARLALSGRVPCKVTDENGPIRPGDLLTTSSTPGHAMRWSLLDVTKAKDFEELKKMMAENERRRHSVIGKAMGTLPSGTGVIPVLVSLQ